MRQTTELRQRQKQTFNARFSTAVRVLQMSGSELEQEVREVLDTNPLLEEVEPATTPAPQSSFSEGELPSVGMHTSDFDSVEMLEYAAHQMDSPSIRDHLHQQVLASGFSEDHRRIADAIVDSIDEQGYLTESIEEIADYLPEPIDELQVESILNLVQQFDPPGIAARDLQECLSLQLETIKSPKSICKIARTIVRDHLDLLSEMQLDQISNILDCDIESVQRAVRLIRSLNPKPASRFGEIALAVTPDVIVRKVDDRWSVELNLSFLPKLRISDYYRSMIETVNSSEERTYLKNKLDGAHAFLDNVSRRHETLLRVARTIIKYQMPFLEHGDHAMKPLKLQQVAEVLDLHSSTVSRACAGKYIITPRGTFELKHFFSVRIKSDAGEDESAMSIKHKMLQIVRSEDQNAPLSDQQIAQLMQDDGIHIARRTIAKYRTEMHVPSCKLRRYNAINQPLNFE